jgi:DNA-binding transcriptional MerR regulator
MDTHYTVRQAIELVGVKAYVLRYWEEELQLEIHRNEMGHRYYTGYDIQLFMNIKELKKRGLQLRAIRNLIPQMPLKEFTIPDFGVPDAKRSDEAPDTGKAAWKAAKSGGNPAKDKKTADDPLSGPSVDRRPDERKIIEFQEILERLIEQELQSKNEEEERCRTLDLAIRRQQMARREAAAAGGRKTSKKQRHT